MPLGYDAEQRVVYLNDSADLYAYLYNRDDAGLTKDSFTAVVFTIRRPDGTRDTNVAGVLQDDGAGYLNYANTGLVGEYIVVATFTLTGGEKRSTRADFQVSDPFDTDLSTPADLNEYVTLTTQDARDEWMVSTVASRVWDKMEDLFDSTDGGPWMRDMTMNVFSPNKVPEFIEEALFDINVYNPPTAFWLDKFAAPTYIQGQNPRQNANLTVLVQGVWIAVIRHLMRTYTEQPAPQGGQVTYEDRRDYLQRWGTMYQIEFQHYDHLVKLWKRQFLGLHQSKQLVSNKAGRLLPAPLRSRNIGRGYY